MPGILAEAGASARMPGSIIDCAQSWPGCCAHGACAFPEHAQR
ncbi:hypothetical protein RSPO_c02293 [Ralstonia solanacearum Po82]|uniref:Uncharacterized protein n=1 Tax=Ralstonia solanacearum (strain Po82) TaxID=1031711 RepID=F6G394_RALS8|nr:hypothetical protein RSPO_c02293 [Ralstonia solanacearum Po82]